MKYLQMVEQIAVEEVHGVSQVTKHAVRVQRRSALIATPNGKIASTKDEITGLPGQ